MTTNIAVAAENFTLRQTLARVQKVVTKMNTEVPGPWVRDLERALATALPPTR